MSIIRKLILSFLLLTICLSLFGCGKKTPLILKDRADLSRTVTPSEEDKHNKK